MQLIEIVDILRETAKPLGSTSFPADWEYRSSKISAIGDFLKLRCTDDGFVDQESHEAPIEFGAQSAFRNVLTNELHRHLDTEFPHRLPQSFSCSETDRVMLSETCANLDYSEKIVIAATAHALTEFDGPIELLSDISAILFEEAYHLKIISDLLNLDQKERPWVPADKIGNLTKVQKCSDIFSYMLVEHALFEGRGGVAAAKGVYVCRKMGVSHETMMLLTKICKQETRHGSLGFLWIDRFGDRQALMEKVHEIVADFIESECADNGEAFNTKRRLYSPWLLNRFFEGEPARCITSDIRRHAAMCMETGDVDIPTRDLSHARDELYRKCLQM